MASGAKLTPRKELRARVDGEVDAVGFEHKDLGFPPLDLDAGLESIDTAALPQPVRPRPHIFDVIAARFRDTENAKAWRSIQRMLRQADYHGTAFVTARNDIWERRRILRYEPPPDC